MQTLENQIKNAIIRSFNFYQDGGSDLCINTLKSDEIAIINANNKCLISFCVKVPYECMRSFGSVFIKEYEIQIPIKFITMNNDTQNAHIHYEGTF